MDFFASSSFAKPIDGLELHFNADGWGPVNGEKVSTFDEVPYAHFDKKDKCYRVADFSQNSYGQPYQRTFQKFNRRDEMGNVDFSYKHDAVEDSTFQLVDTSKTQAKSKSSNTPDIASYNSADDISKDILQLLLRFYAFYSFNSISDQKIWSSRSWQRR